MDATVWGLIPSARARLRTRPPDGRFMPPFIASSASFASRPHWPDPMARRSSVVCLRLVCHGFASTAPPATWASTTRDLPPELSTAWGAPCSRRRRGLAFSFDGE
eukprot:scaffold9654_cov31-Tisochrysis_lutea.AAC.3